MILSAGRLKPASCVARALPFGVVGNPSITHVPLCPREITARVMKSIQKIIPRGPIVMPVVVATAALARLKAVGLQRSVAGSSAVPTAPLSSPAITSIPATMALRRQTHKTEQSTQHSRSARQRTQQTPAQPGGVAFNGTFRPHGYAAQAPCHTRQPRHRHYTGTHDPGRNSTRHAGLMLPMPAQPTFVLFIPTLAADSLSAVGLVSSDQF